jgi:hypothetical protein
MALDIDYVAAIEAIDALEKLLSKKPHGKRVGISDDIIKFVEKMEEKWGSKKKM